MGRIFDRGGYFGQAEERQVERYHRYLPAAFSIMDRPSGAMSWPRQMCGRPQTGTIGATEFDQKHLAIMEGEKRRWPRYRYSFEAAAKAGGSNYTAGTVETLDPVVFLHVDDFDTARLPTRERTCFHRVDADWE